MLAYALYLYLSCFALFLVGFSIFMYFENRKFGDNQFTMKLLPPPPKMPAVAIVTQFHGELAQDEQLKNEQASAFSEVA